MEKCRSFDTRNFEQACVCEQPFKLFWFPIKLNSEQRERLVHAMKREGKKRGTKWEPKESDRECCEDFANGAPSFNNPDPTLSFGYESEKVWKEGTS